MPEKRLMVVGPQPPPVGGGTASVQLLLDELKAEEAIRTIAIDTSPREQNKKTGLFKRGTLRRAVHIARQYRSRLKNVDAVLALANPSLLFSLGSILLLQARIRRVPFYLKPLGGDLSLFLKSRNSLVRPYLLALLRSASGILVQTRQLQIELRRMGCLKTHYVPGFRPAFSGIAVPGRNGGPLRVVFLSQIFREKGPLILLEALRILAEDKGLRVECDFYGPILDEDRVEFLAQLEATPGARYLGTVQTGTTSSLMSRYHVFAFPTFFKGEGHPGVIIEAMQAGIPVISTNHRSIPELITDGENGLLVPVRDSRALAAAIKRLALDHPLRRKMGQANLQRGQEFRSDKIVPRMLDIIFPRYCPPAK